MNTDLTGGFVQVPPIESLFSNALALIEEGREVAEAIQRHKTDREIIALDLDWIRNDLILQTADQPNLKNEAQRSAWVDINLHDSEDAGMYRQRIRDLDGMIATHIATSDAIRRRLHLINSVLGTMGGQHGQS